MSWTVHRPAYASVEYMRWRRSQMSGRLSDFDAEIRTEVSWPNRPSMPKTVSSARSYMPYQIMPLANRGMREELPAALCVASNKLSNAEMTFRRAEDLSP